jgi:hypothetical protein
VAPGGSPSLGLALATSVAKAAGPPRWPVKRAPGARHVGGEGGWAPPGGQSSGRLASAPPNDIPAPAAGERKGPTETTGDPQNGQARSGRPKGPSRRSPPRGYSPRWPAGIGTGCGPPTRCWPPLTPSPKERDVGAGRRLQRRAAAPCDDPDEPAPSPVAAPGHPRTSAPRRLCRRPSRWPTGRGRRRPGPRSTEERPRLLRAAETYESEHRERAVQDPGVAVVPIALPAGR